MSYRQTSKTAPIFVGVQVDRTFSHGTNDSLLIGGLSVGIIFLSLLLVYIKCTKKTSKKNKIK